MGTYFGTDGIRGVAGELLTPELAVQVGRAAAVVLSQKAGPHPLFVIGRDTRLSGPMLEAGLTAGLTSGGARVESELDEAAAVWAAVDEETRRLDGSGRILVRTSGAEELVRVMAEASTHDDVEGACARIVAVVEEYLV